MDTRTSLKKESVFICNVPLGELQWHKYLQGTKWLNYCAWVKKLAFFLHEWKGEERKGEKEQEEEGGWGGEFMCHVQWKLECWGINLHSESIPKAIPTPKASLKTPGHRNCSMERSFCGNQGKSWDSCLCPRGREQREYSWDLTLVHKERVNDFQSQDFYRARDLLEVCRHLVDCHRIRYLKYEPIFPRSEERGRLKLISDSYIFKHPTQ